MEFIREFDRSHGFPPSYDEIAEALGLTAKSGVHRIVGQLEARGFIRRLRRQARSIAIVGTLAEMSEWDALRDALQRVCGDGADSARSAFAALEAARRRAS